MASSTGATATTTPVVVVENWQVVSIVTWVLLITSTLSMVARLSTKYAVSRRFHLDDFFAALALLCEIGSGIATSVEAKHGLGLSIQTQSPDRLVVFAKSLYAADLLYILTVCFAKISIILLINVITPNRTHRRLSMSLLTFIATWSTASFLASAFTCQVPETWNVFSKCFDKAAFWYVFGAINIATDIALVALPTYITIPLHMSKQKKLMLLSCFGARLIDVGVAVVQLTYTRVFRSADFTLDLWPWVLISQVVQCVTVITSCIPYLKPLLESFPSGMFMSDEIRRKGTSLSDLRYALRPTYEEHGQNGSRTMASLPKSSSGSDSNALIIVKTEMEEQPESKVHSREFSTGTRSIIKSTSYSVMHSSDPDQFDSGGLR